MKKSIIISSIVLISVIILLGVLFVLFFTVTYRGTVVSSNAMDDYIEFIITDEETNKQITIVADVHTDVYYCHLEGDIYLGDLMNNSGSTVEVTCKRFFNRNKYSESIVVQFVHESGNTTTNSSNFYPVDLSCENVAQLTAFKCYAAYQDRTITIDGTRAKDLYNLVYNAAGEEEHAPTSSDGNYVYLVFYNSEEAYPSENINTNNFWGTYTIYDDGLLVFSGSPYHSAAFDYKIESDIYNSVIDILSDDD